MTNLKPLKFIFLFCLISASGIAQINKAVDSFERQHQACLDEGKYMLGCSTTFYMQMDSLLNVYYKRLRSTCDSLQKENLKDEQLVWLETRDKFFAENKRQTKVDARKNGYEGGQDEIMIVTGRNAQFVQKRVVELSNSNARQYSPDNYTINAEGFYSLDSKTEEKNGETYGYFGDVKVKALPGKKIVVRFYICKGAPAYSSGSLTDTLTIINNVAVYKSTEFGNCSIKFSFSKRGIRVEESADDLNTSCGFGHGVVANGFFKKKSSKIPAKNDLSDY